MAMLITLLYLINYLEDIFVFLGLKVLDSHYYYYAGVIYVEKPQLKLFRSSSRSFTL